MKFLRSFGSTQQRDAVLASIDYKILARTAGVTGVGIMQGGHQSEPAADEVWYMTKNGELLDSSYFGPMYDENMDRLSVVSNTLVGDHYVVKFSDNIYHINTFSSYNSQLSWAFIPSTVHGVGSGACAFIDNAEENVRYNGDKTVAPGTGWPWNMLA